jgi:uncharacterized protein with HEPN domain
MSRSRNNIVYLYDMLDSATKGISFIRGLSYRKFCADDKTQFALVRAIEIVGEAGKKIPKKIKEENPEIPWREISGMRDKLVHDYFGIDALVVWNTAKHDLPFLKNHLRVCSLR